VVNKQPNTRVPLGKTNFKGDSALIIWFRVCGYQSGMPVFLKICGILWPTKRGMNSMPEKYDPYANAVA